MLFFIFGKVFKGPKLTRISPNKTYAGMLGSFIMTVIFGLLFYNNLNYLLIISSNKGNNLLKCSFRDLILIEIPSSNIS